MQRARGFATTAANFLIRRFRYEDYQFVWRNKMHQQLKGDNALKDAVRNEKAIITEKNISEFHFLSTEHWNDDDLKDHWTLYGLVNGIIKWSCPLYDRGTLAEWYPVSEQEAMEKALSAEDMVPVGVGKVAKVGEAGDEMTGEGSKAAGVDGNKGA